ncbi:MAG TPA: hypothetical protein VF255_03805 [Solirubrobacterales bacterium]
MKVKTLVLAISMLAMAAVPAQAHTLSTGTAKQKIRQQIARECNGCANVSVDRCRRNSPHRVSCRVAATFPEGGKCNWVGIATASHRSSNVRISARDLVCRESSA